MEAVLQYLVDVSPQVLPNHPQIYTSPHTANVPSCYLLQDPHGGSPHLQQQSTRGGLRQRSSRGRRTAHDDSPHSATPTTSGEIATFHGYQVSLSGEAMVLSKGCTVVVRRYDVVGSSLVLESFEWVTEHAPAVFRLVASSSEVVTSLLDRQGHPLPFGSAESGDSPAQQHSASAALCAQLHGTPAPLLASGTQGLQLGDATEEYLSQYISNSGGGGGGGLSSTIHRSQYRSNHPSMMRAEEDSEVVVVRELSFSAEPSSQHQQHHHDPFSTSSTPTPTSPTVSPINVVFADLENAGVASTAPNDEMAVSNKKRAFSSYCVSNERSLDRYNGTSSSFANKAYWFQTAFDDMVARNAKYSRDLEGGWRNWAMGPLKSMERPVIVNSMDEVAAFLHISPTALFAGVAILDHYLASVSQPNSDNLRPNNFRCLVIACPFIASKLLDFRSPTMTRVIESLGLAVDPSVICNAEVAILSSLEFLVHPLTSHDAVDFLQHLPIMVGGEEGTMYCLQDVHAHIAAVSGFLLDCAVRSTVVLHFTAFEVAFAAYEISCGVARATTHPQLHSLLTAIHEGIGITNPEESEVREHSCRKAIQQVLANFGIGATNEAPAAIPRIVRERHSHSVLEGLHIYLTHTTGPFSN